MHPKPGPLSQRMFHFHFCIRPGISPSVPPTSCWASTPASSATARPGSTGSPQTTLTTSPGRSGWASMTATTCIARTASRPSPPACCTSCRLLGWSGSAALCSTPRPGSRTRPSRPGSPASRPRTTCRPAGQGLPGQPQAGRQAADRPVRDRDQQHVHGFLLNPVDVPDESNQDNILQCDGANSTILSCSSSNSVMSVNSSVSQHQQIPVVVSNSGNEIQKHHNGLRVLRKVNKNEKVNESATMPVVAVACRSLQPKIRSVTEK